jgi:hypothetical protein
VRVRDVVVVVVRRVVGHVVVAKPRWETHRVVVVVRRATRAATRGPVV